MSKLIRRRIGKYQSPFSKLVLPMDEFSRDRINQFVTAQEKQSKSGTQARQQYESDIRKKDLADFWQMLSNTAIASTWPIITDPIEFGKLVIPAPQAYGAIADYFSPYHMTPTTSSSVANRFRHNQKVQNFDRKIVDKVKANYSN